MVLATSPALTTPNLGTPSAATLTNATGLPITTGVSGLGTGVATALAATPTGSGSVVLATSPTLTTPTATALNGGQLAGMRNRIINGSFAIDQRNAGASQTITAGTPAYTVDRWLASSTGANVTGQQIAGSGQSRYRYQFTGAAGVTAITDTQRIETANSYDMEGQTVTLAADLADSTLTSVTWTMSYATATDNFTSVTQIATGTFTVNSTVSRYSTQISVPSAATTGLQVTFSVGAQTSGTWTIGNVQLEMGGQATPFEQRTISTEMSNCQRYYFQQAWYVSSLASGVATTGISYHTTMRAAPTISGGGSGFTTVVPSVDGTYFYQTTASTQALTFSSEL